MSTKELQEHLMHRRSWMCPRYRPWFNRWRKLWLLWRKGTSTSKELSKERKPKWDFSRKRQPNIWGIPASKERKLEKMLELPKKMERIMKKKKGYGRCSWLYRTHLGGKSKLPAKFYMPMLNKFNRMVDPDIHLRQ